MVACADSSCSTTARLEALERRQHGFERLRLAADALDGRGHRLDLPLDVLRQSRERLRLLTNGAQLGADLREGVGCPVECIECSLGHTQRRHQA